MFLFPGLTEALPELPLSTTVGRSSRTCSTRARDRDFQCLTTSETLISLLLHIVALLSPGPAPVRSTVHLLHDRASVTVFSHRDLFLDLTARAIRTIGSTHPYWWQASSIWFLLRTPSALACL
ncbi:hypothetical protein T02_2371 [Trichinella nativa]|uniref:Uncharacterized protein n=1 Tax=Trichinella nativa TaxID=6335 RepID=A0A0V1L8Z5_9BILA|nr:hypothetical protein T02_2371 [Trichinella nativa]